MKSRLIKVFASLVLVVLAVFLVVPNFSHISAAENTYQLVTDASTLAEGDKIVIACTDKSVAMGDQNGNYRNKVDVTISDDGNVLTYKDGVCVLTLGGSKDAWTLEADGGFLYYISDTKNTLNTDKDKSNYTWKIEIKDGTTTITSVDIADRVIQYNSGSPRFACYTGTQQNVSIYKLVDNAGGGSGEGTGGGSEKPACTHSNTTDVPAVPATCTTPGTTAGVKCSDCAEVLSGCETVPALGHKYENGACSVCGEKEPPKYALVTDVKDLNAGDKIIIVDATNCNYALSTKQNTNNRGQVAITKDSEGKITINPETQVITLEKVADGTFAFKVNDGYLYAASSSNNHLKTQTTNNNNGSWKIEINSAGVATITAQGTYTRNLLRYNSSSKIFSCYGSGQQDVSIYKLEETAPAIKGMSATLNKGVTINVKYDIPALWLNANPGAKAVFSNGVEVALVAGVNVCSVDLKPGEINDDLTVKIQIGDTVYGEATDVSFTAYRNKIKATDAATLGITETKYNALVALINAALKYSTAADKSLVGNLEADFAGVAEKNVFDTETFLGYAGTLGEYATMKILVNKDNVTDQTFTVKVGEKTVVDAQALADYVNAEGHIVIDKLYPTHFNDVITIQVKNGETTATALEFTFNSYLKYIYGADTSDAALKNLAAATYLYGVAAEAFVN